MGMIKLKKIFAKKETVRNSLYVIDSSIDNKVKFRFHFGMSEEGKQLFKLKESRRRETTTINTNSNTQIPIEKNNQKVDIKKRNNI